MDPIVADSTPTKLSETDFEALLSRAAETGVRSYTESHKPAETVVAKMAEAGIASGLDNIGGLNIPFGSVFIGAIPGVIVAELIDGVVSPRTSSGGLNWINPVAKGVAAWAGAQYGRKLMGRDGSMFFAGTLGLSILTQVLPINQWVAQMVGALRPGAASVVSQAEAHMYQFQASSKRPEYMS